MRALDKIALARTSDYLVRIYHFLKKYQKPLIAYKIYARKVRLTYYIKHQF